MQRFFDLPHARWRRMDRCLHLYAIPEQASDLLAATSTTAAALSNIRGIEVQPSQFVHVTLQRFDAYEEDLTTSSWQALLDDAPQVFAKRQPFELSFAKPRAMSHAVEAVAEGGLEWATLIAGIRTTVLRHLPARALTPPPLVPHYTVAYCTQDRTDEPVTSALTDTARRTRMRIGEVSLVSVTQSPEQGTFSFDILERWSLGDRLRSPQNEREQEPVR